MSAVDAGGPSAAAGTPADVGRLRWRCRRGMKELDLLLSRYLDQRYAHACPAERDAFARLLEAQDPLIYAYVLGKAAPADAALAALIGHLVAGPANA